ncbi:MAG: HD domain-containing protein [Oscillospiraceae bacterium]|nr:HD domain-containing protein [Oscillospiraceae bacterium]
MTAIYYDIMFSISLILTTVYAMLWHKHFDIHISLLFIFIPIANAGYVLTEYADTAEAAGTASKIVYLGGCFLMLFSMLAVLSLCHVEMPRIVRGLLIGITTVVYLSVMTIGYSALFYRTFTMEIVHGEKIFHKEYGIMHSVCFVMVMLYFLISFTAAVYSWFKKRDVSNRTIALVFLLESIAIIGYLVRNFFSFELMPLVYTSAQVIYLIIIRRLLLYDVVDSAIDSIVDAGSTGFISFDMQLRYLGSNETARRILPDLETLTVDKPLKDDCETCGRVRGWLNAFQDDNKSNAAHLERDGKSYQVTVNALVEGERRRGYQLLLTDDTDNQKLIRMIQGYNDDLAKEVAEKTAHIVKMHDKLILSMAAMVESRDNSTGGHIRRTSEGVRMLIEAMQQAGDPRLNEEFCRDIIKAAPMHDLGKIAVDDAVLRKPGRFTDEEFEKMKIHASEGARIVREILTETGDHSFRIVAENVAHYHHERWDGTGYPEKRRGEDIPLEARIMAIADVYDALVSKRVYKDSMSFEKANAIIMEGMGTQFDPGLEQYYVAARPKLEEYYSIQNETIRTQS